MKAFLMCLLILVSTNTVSAEPLRVDADRFELAQDNQQAEFMGHVVAIRDGVKLTAEYMKIWYEKDEITQKNTFKKAKATGNVVIISNDTHAKADEAIMVADSDIVTLIGAASINSPQGTLTGEHIEYNTITKNVSVLPSATGGKAHFVFEEKKNP